MVYGDKELKVEEYASFNLLMLGKSVEGFPLCQGFKLHLCETSRHKLEGAIRDNTDELAKVLTQEMEILMAGCRMRHGPMVEGY